MDRNTYDFGGKPYNVAQLQGEFHVISPSEAYAELCHRFQCRPITAVAKMFSKRVGCWSETTTLDFSLLYVGPKGMRPIVEMCKRLPSLKSLNWANNYLSNDSVYHLAQMAVHHPSLEFIELSGNEFISWTGGSYLVEVVSRNSNLKEVGLRDTSVPSAVGEAIFEQTRKNCVLACQQMGRIPHPSRHPTVIHLRAMKRYFIELQEGGTVPASALAEGFRERLRILGQERDIISYTEVFFEKLCSRAPSERIEWEVFLVILLLDSVYDEYLVKKFHRVFLEYNIEPAAGIEGLVEVRDLVSIHTRLHGKPPAPEEINSMYKTLDLDETMTLNWDEFLLLMYSCAPKEKCFAVGWTHTPLQHSRTARRKTGGFGVQHIGMFAAPKCILGGEIPAPSPCSAVYCDPCGAVWTVDASGTNVYFYTAAEIESLMTNYSLSDSNKNEIERDPVYECERGDHVLSIVFPWERNEKVGFVCIVTAEGHLALGNAENPSAGLLRNFLGVGITAALAVSESDEAPEGVGILVSCFDGTFSEVIFVRCNEWRAACGTASSITSTLPSAKTRRDGKRSNHNTNHSVGEASVTTGVAKEELVDDNEHKYSKVAAAALFRICGRLQSLMLDETGERLVTVAQSGDVDVWNWRQGTDETSVMGMPSYRADEHGEPVCATLLPGNRLWVGSDAGAIVVFALRPGAAEATADPVRVWPAHEGAVHSLLRMSFGRCVWSYGADGQARVWDAAQRALLGSFAFSGGGLAALCRGPAALDATLWGVDAGTGAAAWLSVRESVSAGREAAAARDARDALAAHEAFAAHLCALLAGPDAAAPLPPPLRAALCAVEESVPGARALPGAIAAAAAASRAIRRALADTAAPARGLLEDVQVLLRDRRGERARDAEWRRGLEDIAGIIPGAGSLNSMDDAVEAVRRLASSAREPSESVELGKPCPMTPSPLSESLLDTETEKEMQRVSVELAKERQAHAEAAQKFTDAEAERRELLRRVEQADVRQDEDERRIGALERALATARRAAAVTAANASHLSEMEARLAEAHRTIAALQGRAEDQARERKGLTHDAAETSAELQRFAAKEELARRAFGDFIATENGIMDRIEELRCATSTTALRAGVEALHGWFSKRIDAQRTFHAGLKQSFAAHYKAETKVVKANDEDEPMNLVVNVNEEEDSHDGGYEEVEIGSADQYEGSTKIDEIEEEGEEDEEEEKRDK